MEGEYPEGVQNVVGFAMDDEPTVVTERVIATFDE